MMLQQLQYDSYVGGEVLERRDTHYVGSVFLVVIFRSTICQNQHCIGSLRLVTVNIMDTLLSSKSQIPLRYPASELARELVR